MARMIIKLMQVLFLIVSAVLLAGCLGTDPKTVRTSLPSATLTLSEDAPGAETLAMTVTAIPLPSRTPEPSYTPEPTRTPIPTRTAMVVPTPGPDLSFLFLRDGSILRYYLQTWSEESLAVPVSGTVDLAAISPDGQWLAFYDKEGVKVSKAPFVDARLAAIFVRDWGRGLVFNKGSDLLAFSDEEGLKVLNLFTSKERLLVSHVLLSSGDWIEELRNNQYYYPEAWSKNGSWLVVHSMVYEFQNLELLYVPSLTLYEFTDCYSRVDWNPASLTLVVSVVYSAMHNREEKDGIYIVSARDEKVTEQRIYYDAELIPITHRGSSYPGWNPSGDLISFVQDTYSEDTTSLINSRLMLIHPADSRLRELASSTHGIDTPVWAAEGNNLFYVIQGEVSKIVRIDLDSGEQWDYELAGNKSAELVSLSPDDRWLIVNGYIQAGKGYTTYLVNTESGNGILLGEIDEFIGWER